MYKPDVQLWRVGGIGPLTGWDFYEGNKSKLLRQGALPLSLTRLIPARMYEGEVTTGVPAEAIVSPTSTTAHGPNTSEIAH